MDGFTGYHWFRGQNRELVAWVIGLCRKHDRKWRYETNYRPEYCFVCTFGGPSGESGYDDLANMSFWTEFREELDARGVEGGVFCDGLSQSITEWSGQGAFGHCWPMLHGNLLDRVVGALHDAGWSNEAEVELRKTRPLPDRDMRNFRESLRPKPIVFVYKSREA